MVTNERSITSNSTAAEQGAVLAELRNATKRFGTGVATVEAVNGHRPHRPRRRAARRARPQRRRQDDSDQHAHRPAAPDKRHGATLRSRSARPRGQTAGRGHAPGLRRARDAPRPRAARRVPRLLPRSPAADHRYRRHRPGRARATPVTASCPAASSDASCSRSPCVATPSFSSSTSPRPAWTSRCGVACGRRSAT